MAGKGVARQATGPTNLTFEGARIVFRNFAGKEGLYNAEGERNFCLLLDEKDAVEMADQGWNIKTLKPRDPEDAPQPYIQVKVGFVVLPPTIKIITSRGATQVFEDMLEMLDFVEFSNIDLIIRPREWSVRGDSGVKAYLKTFFGTVLEDYLELKYADVPDSHINSLDSKPLLELEGGEDSILMYQDDDGTFKS